jgi:ABC-2 type transport system ATP-binding protein
MQPEILIEVEHLYRYYSQTCAVNNVTFRLHKGEVLGFLGPNGAGKSSTMQVISGNLAPSAGRISVHGIDLLDSPKRAKARIGYLPEQPPLYREFTVDEYLRYCARLHRVPRQRIRSAVDTAMERCGLGEAARRLIGNLSKGFQQRVGIAQAILHTPAVVILDEPTVGLDPIQIREIRELIRELGREHGIILSTHILPEVQSVCTHVQIIHQGRLVFSESIAGLEQHMDARSLVASFHAPPPVETLMAIPGVRAVERVAENRMRLHFAEQDPAEALVEGAVANNWRLFELHPERRSLEQIFVELTCSEPVPTGGKAA